ncbi:MAG: hypothetical protein ACE5FN_07930 [Leptospirillia bacterium]
MRHTHRFFAPMAIPLAALLLLVLSTPATWAGGMEHFEKYGCISCHNISAYGIGEPTTTGEAWGPPDLSDVGKRRDVAFLKGFLKKKVDIDGRKHMMLFSGSNEELTELTSWLVTHTKPPLTAPE